MASKKRIKGKLGNRSSSSVAKTGSTATGRKMLLNALLAFCLGGVVSVGASLAIFLDKTSTSANENGNPRTTDTNASGRTLTQLLALSDVELENVDLVEMNLAVAREVPGFEELDYASYRDKVNRWTKSFESWLLQAEAGFHAQPAAYHNDIAFYRLGMVAQYLDDVVGLSYVEERRQAQIEARRTERMIEVTYSDPNHLFLHGLIDTKRGTCANMPVLHVAIARRMGWSVSLACAGSHYVCRLDAGKAAYSMESTYIGDGGFAAGSGQDYVQKQGVSPRAIAVGSDLRKLTAREMLGVFVQARARHFADTGRADFAARDYALAHTLFPKSRTIYIGLVGNLLPVGEDLFAPYEHGHPVTLAAHLNQRYGSPRGASLRSHTPSQGAHLLDIEEITAMNQANRERMRRIPVPVPQPHGPGSPQPGQPSLPVAPPANQPYYPHQPYRP